MNLVLASLWILLASGVAALAAGRQARWASRLGAGGVVLGAATGLVPVVQCLATGTATRWEADWSVPLGSLSLGLDPLSAVFALATLGVSALAAVYGTGYLRHGQEGRNLGPHWFFFNLLVAAMLLVVLARNAVLFLVAWEVMALASYALVVHDDERESVRRAGWVYLVATHVGTAFVLALFALLGARTHGALDFSEFALASVRPDGLAGTAFVFAVIGFGTKAGLVPLHGWLPEAHPAAPSHVSAVMSGVMIKTGIYGLLRTLSLLGPPPAWWGWLLVVMGAVSAVLGVLFALAQHDLKRLLAYHSVENLGIIVMGCGVGLLGVNLGNPALAALGFGGALLHVLNHALFKSLLFLAAGAVGHGAHTLEIDHLGGLGKRMPWTAAAFLVGAVAISALPPLNGFVSEFLIYVGALRSVVSLGLSDLVWGLVVIGALALAGGLAAACFAKAFGTVFLGEPRTAAAARAHEVPWVMRLPMLVLAAACALIGLAAPVAARLTLAATASIMGLRPGLLDAEVETLAGPLRYVSAAGLGLLLLVGLLTLVRNRLLARHGIAQAGTWDCGYVAPTARMQYTSSSFAQPLTALFAPVLRLRRTLTLPSGLFPTQAHVETAAGDVFNQAVYGPLWAGITWVSAHLRRLQHGRLQVYILYIALTLVLLLLWRLR